MLPLRSGLYLIRNTLYFGGHEITLPIVVLGIYVLVGAVVVRMLCWRGHTRSTGGGQTEDEELANRCRSPRLTVRAAAGSGAGGR